MILFARAASETMAFSSEGENSASSGSSKRLPTPPVAQIFISFAPRRSWVRTPWMQAGIPSHMLFARLRVDRSLTMLIGKLCMSACPAVMLSTAKLWWITELAY